MGVKLHYLGDDNPGPRGGKVYMFHCPGCECAHPLEIEAPNGTGWTWNGSMEAPTFRPSLFCNRDIPHAVQCHSWITDGYIQFLSDSSHKLAGKNVEIPDWDEAEK